MPIALPDRLPVAPPSVASTRPDTKPPVPEAPGATPTPFAKLVHALGHEAERGEATVRSVLRGARGGELCSADLLALQAGIYRYGETIDLAAKLVDKAGTDVKTVLTGSQ